MISLFYLQGPVTNQKTGSREGLTEAVSGVVLAGSEEEGVNGEAEVGLAEEGEVEVAANGVAVEVVVEEEGDPRRNRGPSRPEATIDQWRNKMTLCL